MTNRIIDIVPAEMKFSASAAACWSKCTAQPAFVASLQAVDKPSPYAERGSMLHALIADKLQGKAIDMHGLTLDDQIQLNTSIEIGKQIMKRAMQIQWHYEQKLQLDFTNEVATTAIVDLIGLAADGTLIIVDWKFGRNPVPAQNNKQLICYAMAAYRYLAKMKGNYQVTNIEAHIVQPQGESTNWVFSLDELKTRFDELEEAVRQATNHDPENPPAFVPDKDTCLWCVAKAYCGSYHRVVEHNAKLIDVDTLPKNEIAKLMMVCDMAAKLKLALTDRALTLLKYGDAVAGLKLTKGRQGNRKWANDQAVLDAANNAGIDPYEQNLTSPTKLEKRIGKKRFKDIFAEHVDRAEGLDKVTYDGSVKEDLSYLTDGFNATATPTLPEASTPASHPPGISSPIDIGGALDRNPPASGAVANADARSALPFSMD